jgi:hypothetical protein
MDAGQTGDEPPGDPEDPVTSPRDRHVSLQDLYSPVVASSVPRSLCRTVTLSW